MQHLKLHLHLVAQKDLPGLAAGFHFISQLNVLGVNVKLPLSLAQNAGQHGARMDTDAHINR